MKNVDQLYPFFGQYAEVQIKEKRHFKSGLIDKTGAFVIPPIYDNIQYRGGDLVAVNIGWRSATMNHFYPGKWGILNLKNEWVIPLKYSDIEEWQDGKTFTVCYRNRWGAINDKGEVVIKFIFDLLFTPNEFGLISAKVEGKWGWVDITGKPIIQMLYDDTSITIEKAEIPWVGVRQGDEWFYIDQTGKRVLL